jgi:hypothetical protein
VTFRLNQAAFGFDASKPIGDREIQGLSDVLIDCVEGGASVSFMLPIFMVISSFFVRRRHRHGTRAHF